MNYREALEFIGEVRAGISWDRFCVLGVRYSDALIAILNDTEEARQYLSSTGIGSEYATDQIKKIFYRLHFNKENDHYLTLALPHDAQAARIHKRWKELMLLYHPDRNRDELAASCAAKINEAYSGVKSAEKRVEYDRNFVRSLKRHNPGKPRGNMPPPRKYVFMSTKTAETVSKLVMPLCVGIAVVVLFVLFLENRQEEGVQHAVVTGHQKPLHQEGGGSPPPGADIPGGQEKSQPPVPEGGSPVSRAEQHAAEGQERSAFADKGAIPPAAGSAAVRNEQKAAPRNSPVRETKKTVVPVAGEKKSAGGEASAEPSISGRQERGGSDDREVPVKKAVDAPRETHDEKANTRAPAAQPRDVVETVPENIDRQVHLFAGQYRKAYEEGDIEKFMSLFSKSAIENDRMNYEEIRRAYKKNFESSRYRYILDNVRSVKNGDGAIVAATYVIRKQDENGGGIVKQGDIRWLLVRESGALKIAKVNYERR